MAKGRYHWSNGAYVARFFVLHWSACVPLLILVLHPSWTLLYVAVGWLAFLLWVEKILKMTLAAFARAINIWVTGRVKASINLLKELTR